MLPNHPLFSTLKDIGEFFMPDAPYPAVNEELPHNYSAGPIVINESADTYTKNIWAMEADGTSVRVFDTEVSYYLFDAAEPVEELAFAFDQLGRVLVFYRTGDDDLFLYWRDPVAEADVITPMGKGYGVAAGFDMVHDPTNADSDVMLYYVTGEYSFAMLLQRDRWETVYPYTTELPIYAILQVGLRKDWRYQVLYSEIDLEATARGRWTPEDKVTGEWVAETIITDD